MKFTYRLQKDGSCWLAQCVESDAMGEGQTEQDAVRSLHESLTERMFRPDAIAPPETSVHGSIELTPAPESTTHDAADFGGPGG